MFRSRIVRSLITAAACILAAGCAGVQPQRVTATGTVSGTDGLGQPTQETFSLTHNVGEPPSARLVTRRILINNVTGFNLAVTRTGFPINETFILINLSRTAVAPGEPLPTVVSADPTYIADHVGQLVSLSVDTSRLDSPLTATRPDPFPGRQRTGYTVLARWEADDPCMPFEDAAQPIDFSRFQNRIFTTLSTVITAADAASPLFRLGGSGDDGDFELYFVPHSQHSTLAEFGTPRNGFTLIFKATIIAGLVEAKVYVPLSIIFARVPSVGGNAFLNGFLDLIELGQSSDDRRRITVEADGVFELATGSAIRQAVLDALTTPPPATLNNLTLAMGAFSGVLNSFRPNGGAAPLPETVRVVLFPGPVPEGSLNRLIPGGIQPRLCILD